MTKESFGFLTVIDHSRHGLFGGYLVVNVAGRPLEFHCTAPIRPSRAQEILYGNTLRPYLYGEQIGRTLLEKSKLRPKIVCTDHREAMSVRASVDMPIALILGSDVNNTGQQNDPFAIGHEADATGIRSLLSTSPTRESDNRSGESGSLASSTSTLSSTAMSPVGVAERDERSLTQSWRIDAARDGSPAMIAFRLGTHRVAISEDRPRDRELVTQQLGPMAQTLDLSEPFQRIRDAVDEARRGG
jgi:hypothetical protein